MIAFRVFRNDSEVCLAGVDGLGILSAIVTWANRSGEFSESGQPEESLDLTIGALHTLTEENLMWPTERLSVGDSVMIRIERADEISEPCTRKIYSKESSLEVIKSRARELAAELGWTLIESETPQAELGTPNRSSPPTLNSTSSVRGSEDS